MSGTGGLLARLRWRRGEGARRGGRDGEEGWLRPLGLVAGVHTAVLLLVALLSPPQRAPVRTEVLWLEAGGAPAGPGAETPAADSPAADLQLAEAMSLAPPVEWGLFAGAEPVPATSAQPEEPTAPEPVLAEVEPPAPEESEHADSTPVLPRAEADTDAPVLPTPATATPKPPAKSTPVPKRRAAPTPTKGTPKAVARAPKLPKAQRGPVTTIARAPTTAARRAGTPAASTPAAGSGGAGSAPAAGSGGSGGSTGSGRGAGSAAEMGTYHSVLRDLLYASWRQPTSIVRSDQVFVTRVLIRIARDGTLVGRELAATSGNSVMDESVLAAAREVTKVEPLPEGAGETYAVPVDFRLDQDP